MTIHNSRTLMFTELSKVMDHAIEDNTYLDSLDENITNKLTRTNQLKTNSYLRHLYGFDIKFPPFVCFRHFWQQAEGSEKRIITLLFAIGQDFLLSESIPVVIKSSIGEKVTVKEFEDNVGRNHPKRYSEKTRKSIAQNLASSWKQAGYIAGKVKNIRTKTTPGFHSVAFALLMSYLNGERGEFMLRSKWIQALDLSEPNIRELAFEASKRDLLQYQYSGNVTTFSFSNLFSILNINSI